VKRIVSILFLSVWALAASAQGGGIPLLDRVEGHRVTFHYTYSLSRQGSEFTPVTDGDVTVEGNAYILEGLGLKVISNGITRWTQDEDAREVLVEKVEQEDLFTNPALFIGSYRRYMDRIRVNAAGTDSLDVTLTLDESTKARFQLQHIVYGVLQGKSDFSLDEKSLSGEEYVITDLR
jgi:hypothetical protein